MKSIFDKEAYQELSSRLEELTPGHQAKWGKMNVNQMLSHCQKVIQVALGEKDLKRPNFFVRFLLQFMNPMLYNDKAWIKGLPTAKEFVISDTEGFETEKAQLKALMKRMHYSKEYFKPSKEHPVFGKMKVWMWGQSGYKHLDHHFQQFGV
ncbi:DUF1569 domain-containing protein [Psychroflexus sediminis]|uniref:DUF1569 domain-containing protein n=1 Tax=Psychroflexus sediminis TaxID=470826 RepID=A0A1G7XYL8_9FLAO|nr:DUF1569 domain-containing protein [Psychroflexus sediminis]SDG89322.1 Protein of unknown function [Psychroflexus sediminis]